MDDPYFRADLAAGHSRPRRDSRRQRLRIPPSGVADTTGLARQRDPQHQAGAVIVKLRRSVAFDAAEDDLVPAKASTPGPVPILGSLKAGWVFFFTHFRQIAMRLWLSAILLGIIEAIASAPNASPGAWLALAYVLLYLLAFA